MNKDKLPIKCFLTVILNFIFPIILFSLMFTYKSEIAYLNNFNSYQPISLKLNLISIIIIFKIVMLSILFCYFVIEIFIYQKFLINILNKISIILVSFYLLLQILFFSLSVNTYVTYNGDNHYNIFSNLNYIGLYLTIIYLGLLILFYYLYILPIQKEIDSITNEYLNKEVIENGNMNKFKKLKKEYEENKISEDEYKNKLTEILNEEIKDISKDE